MRFNCSRSLKVIDFCTWKTFIWFPINDKYCYNIAKSITNHLTLLLVPPSGSFPRQTYHAKSWDILLLYSENRTVVLSQYTSSQTTDYEMFVRIIHNVTSQTSCPSVDQQVAAADEVTWLAASSPTARNDMRLFIRPINIIGSACHTSSSLTFKSKIVGGLPPFSLLFLLSLPYFPLEVGPLNPTRASGGPLVHFGFKIWHLMTVILMIFLRLPISAIDNEKYWLTHLGEMPGVGGRFARVGGFSPM